MPTAVELSRNQEGYFTIEDVGADELTFTIRAVATKEVGKDKDVKMVVSFSETPRGLILNKTRTEQLVDAFGKSELIGKRVTLYTDELDVQGRRHKMICLRGATA